ncbi:Kinesin light chain 3 [Rhizophlyctis rosea]|nr:Kinesin light chain 3 [Rhizophlyctis rosea]
MDDSSNLKLHKLVIFSATILKDDVEGFKCLEALRTKQLDLSIELYSPHPVASIAADAKILWKHYDVIKGQSLPKVELAIGLPGGKPCKYGSDVEMRLCISSSEKIKQHTYELVLQGNSYFQEKCVMIPAMLANSNWECEVVLEHKQSYWNDPRQLMERLPGLIEMDMRQYSRWDNELRVGSLITMSPRAFVLDVGYFSGHVPMPERTSTPYPSRANPPSVTRQETIHDASFPRGVRLSFLDVFIQNFCGGEETVLNMTTETVCEIFVKPLTKPSESALCDILPASAVGKATWFVSHSWQYTFLDLVNALKSYFHDQGMSQSAVVWIDLFSLPQHNRDSVTSNWLTTTFFDTIASIVNVIMILHPWDNPIVLKRAWCIFELYTCRIINGNFRFWMPPAGMPSFQLQLITDPNAFFDVVEANKSAESVSTKPEDRDMIHDTIIDTIGHDAFEHLDCLVLQSLYHYCHGVVKETHPEEVRVTERLAELYMKLDNPEAAEPLYEECFAKRRALGQDYELTIQSLTKLVECYRAQGKHEKAEDLYNDKWDVLQQDMEGSSSNGAPRERKQDRKGKGKAID